MALFIGVVVLCLVSLSHQESCEDPRVPGGGKLSRDLLRYVSRCSREESFVISGYSLIDPLQMLSYAAEGNTKKQLEAALSPLPKPLSRNEEVCKTYLHGGANYTKASRLYLSTAYKVDPTFSKAIEKNVGSDVKNINFQNTKAAANEINNWVSKKTSDLIKSLVNSQDLDGAIGVIVNTLYFEARWDSTFSKGNTKVDDFFVSPNIRKRVPFMRQVDFYKLGYSPELFSQVLEIPFRGFGRSMKIIFPEEQRSLPAVVTKIAKENYTVEYEIVYVNLSLPKFEVETSTNLMEFLREIGVKDIFEAKSQLPHLTTSSSHVIIDKAVQKANIKLDENGVRAAAANEIAAIGYRPMIPPILPKPIELKLNRPFYFEINFNQKVLFNGVYRGPAESE